MRTKGDDNDDVMKILMTMALTLTTLTIAMSTMMTSTMVVSMPPFFLS